MEKNLSLEKPGDVVLIIGPIVVGMPYSSCAKWKLQREQSVCRNLEGTRHIVEDVVRGAVTSTLSAGNIIQRKFSESTTCLKFLSSFSL